MAMTDIPIEVLGIIGSIVIGFLLLSIIIYLLKDAKLL